MAKDSSLKNQSGANLGFEAILWSAADKLRGHIDPAEYKHIVLGLIFLKYISDAFEEKYSGLVSEHGADPEDADEYRAENIFWVPKNARWSFLQANAKQPTIGRLIDEAMLLIEKDNDSLKSVLPHDYANQKLNKERLGELIDLISTIALGDKENRSKDILGRVYEYFLSQFASAEGKKGGEFFTPRCVVRLLVEMLSPSVNSRVYDPCCGSGGMFVQSEEFIAKHGGRIGDIAVYGQELNNTTWKLAKMNMAIRGIDADIRWNDQGSFRRDAFPDLKADFILANPPFNDKEWGGDHLRDDVRWKFGVPPSSNANFGWVQHFIHHLAPNGIAGFVLANASLSSEPGSEAIIRKNIIDADLVDCIVTLPGQLFYSTPIPVCLWFMTRNKNNPQFRNRCQETLFIDASKLGRSVTRTARELNEEDIALIAATYQSWRNKNGAYKDIGGFCKSVKQEEIIARSYTLFPSTFIEVVGKQKAVTEEYFGQIIQDYQKQLTAEFAKQQKINSDLVKAFDQLFLHGVKKYDGAYKKYKLSDVLETSEERLGLGTEPEILTCTERAGLILQRERFAKRIATENTSKYKVVRKTDIVYNPYLLWAGSVDQCWIVDIGITSPAYEVLRVKKGFDPVLVGHLITSDWMIKHYDGISIGTVQRRRRAPVEKFLELEVFLPPFEEQKKLSPLLLAAQELIAANRKTNAELSSLLEMICDAWLEFREEDASA